MRVVEGEGKGKGKGGEEEGKGGDPTPSRPPNPYFWIRPCPFSFVICCFVSGGAELQEGSGLARAWTTRGPKVLSTNARMKRRGRRGDS